MMDSDEKGFDFYSDVIKEQARNESDNVRKLKRKIEDTPKIKKELSGDEFDLLVESLDNEAENLEQIASMSDKILEEKLDAADQEN